MARGKPISSYKMKRVLELYVEEGLTLNEVAETLQLSKTSTYNILKDAKVQMRRTWKKNRPTDR